MTEALKNIPEQVKETSQLPEAIQKMVIKSFRELFGKPEFAAKVQEKIDNLNDPIIKIRLSNALAETRDLNADINKVHEKTHDRLKYLMASIDPKITQAYNSNTTA